MNSMMCPPEAPILLLILAGLFTLTLWITPATANPIPVGPCCFPDDRCEMLPEDACVQMGGIFVGLGGCEPSPCPVSFGACCYPDGTCAVMTQTACQALPFTWMGPNTNCDPNPCTPCLLPCVGVCCFLDGHCAAVPRDQCLAESGIWQDGAYSCTPDPCATSSLPEELRTMVLNWGKIKRLYR
jgi:hypothetical protein